jgi:hypothetical protein
VDSWSEKYTHVNLESGGVKRSWGVDDIDLNHDVN